jgi:hypothetical protein
MTTKSSADDSQIAVLLKDFDDADMLLGKVGNNVFPDARLVAFTNTHHLIRLRSRPKPGVMPGSLLQPTRVV